MEWVEDVFYGAVTKGVNDTTVAVFKAVCLASIASLAILTYICYTQYPELLIHCIFALSLSVFLYALMHWFLGELGTVSPAEQRKELFGDQTQAIHSTKASDINTNATEPGTAVAAPKDRQTKKVE
ncbi:hypothetical protein ABBQ38_002624 [Trebouxia sp. C0009 RCD-2024]